MSHQSCRLPATDSSRHCSPPLACPSPPAYHEFPASRRQQPPLTGSVICFIWRSDGIPTTLSSPPIRLRLHVVLYLVFDWRDLLVLHPGCPCVHSFSSPFFRSLNLFLSLCLVLHLFYSLLFLPPARVTAFLPLWLVHLVDFLLCIFSFSTRWESSFHFFPSKRDASNSDSPWIPTYGTLCSMTPSAMPISGCWPV